MKLSARKKGQIYDLVHEMISNLRINLRRNYLPPHYSTLNNQIDYQIAKVEVPLAQKIMKLLEGENNKE